MKPGPKAIIRELLAELEKLEGANPPGGGEGRKEVKARAALMETARAYLNRKPAKRNAAKRRAGELVLKQGQTVNVVHEAGGKSLFSVTYHGEGMLEVFSPDTEILLSPRDPATVSIFKGGLRK